MSNWYKLCCFNEGNEDWMVHELGAGRVRYGWSPPGSDLRKLDQLSWEQLDKIELGNDDWRATASGIYRKGVFLLYRIKPGDHVVVNLSSPIREFWVVKVTQGYDYPAKERQDFNHILVGTLLTPRPVPYYSKYVSNELRHSLSKRGRYYRIYSEDSVEELRRIVEGKYWTKDDVGEESSQAAEMDKMKEELIKNTIALIQRKWQGKDFEYFVADVLNKIEGVEVKSAKDSGKGWDMTLTLRDPLTGDVLVDDVPVQCKNYSGEVVTTKPIEDLERCIENSPRTVSVAYLVILGTLTSQFDEELETLKAKLKGKQNHRTFDIRVVDERQIAMLYLGLREGMAI